MSFIVIFNIGMMILNLMGAVFFYRNAHSAIGWSLALLWCIGYYSLSGQLQ